MAVRESVFSVIKSSFHKHGAEQIDTPVFELKVKMYENLYCEDVVLNKSTYCNALIKGPLRYEPPQIRACPEHMIIK